MRRLSRNTAHRLLGFVELREGGKRPATPDGMDAARPLCPDAPTRVQSPLSDAGFDSQGSSSRASAHAMPNEPVAMDQKLLFEVDIADEKQPLLKRALEKRSKYGRSQSGDGTSRRNPMIR